MLSAQVVQDIAELRRLGPEWGELLRRSANNAPALSPEWLLPWWDLFGAADHRQLKAVTFREGARLVGLAPLSLRRRSHGRYRGLHRLELLGSGEDESEAIASDYIGVIAESGAELAVAQGLTELLAGSSLGPWDDAVFDSMNGGDLFPALLAGEARASGMHVVAEMVGAAPHIALPESWEAYLAALSSGRRRSLKRTLQQFERWAGPDHHYRRASSPGDLVEGFRILVDLHQARWSEAGRPGVFAARRFSAFHEAVMPRLLQAGALDLTWLCAHQQPVAAAYSILWNGKVHFYQGGRSMQVPASVKPGLVLHAHNIRTAIAAGMKEYDFLGGISRYKIELATATRPLMRVRIVHPSLRNNLLQVAGVVRRQLRALAAHPVSHPFTARIMGAILHRKQHDPRD